MITQNKNYIHIFFLKTILKIENQKLQKQNKKNPFSIIQKIFIVSFHFIRSAKNTFRISCEIQKFTCTCLHFSVELTFPWDITTLSPETWISAYNFNRRKNCWKCLSLFSFKHTYSNTFAKKHSKKRGRGHLICIFGKYLKIIYENTLQYRISLCILNWVFKYNQHMSL